MSWDNTTLFTDDTDAEAMAPYTIAWQIATSG
jgi:hypothetical protein